MFEILQLPFVQRAFVIGGVSAVAFGLVGTFIVVRRIGYLAGAIAHTAFGGIGIGLYLQYLFAGTILAHFFPPMGIAVAAALLSAVLVGVIKNRVKEREDTVIGIVWAVGMSLGLLLMNAVPSNVNISNYLFGDIILNTPNDAVMVLVLSAAVLVFVFVFFQRLEAVCFDEEFTELRGIKARQYFYLLLLLCALTVVLLLRIVGIVLVIAMLTLPAAAACRFAQRLSSICVLSVLFGAFSTWGGILLSIGFDISTGPTIVLTAALLYIAALFKPVRKSQGNSL